MLLVMVVVLEVLPLIIHYKIFFLWLRLDAADEENGSTGARSFLVVILMAIYVHAYLSSQWYLFCW